jgi:hypothetical protein
MTLLDLDGLWLVRLLLQRGLAAIYLVAFVSAKLQFPALLGERGLQPVPRWLSHVSFREAPSVFHAHYSDRFFGAVAWAGIALSTAALLGLPEAGPVWVSVLVWLTLWALYLSIVNVGQTFYAFGWESMLVEAGFFAAFLGPSHIDPSPIPILALRWMLFRVELGAGLIKIRHDRCWRDLTCLYYHHETQPLPGPLSARAHRLPKTVHRLGVLFSHFVQLVVPFGLFFPQPVASVCGGLIILHQLFLIATGNYAWLNWLTVVLAVTALSDAVLAPVLPFAIGPAEPRALGHEAVLYLLGAVTILLSIKPALNLLSKEQLMNYNYNPLHLVNAYGAFGSVTRERYEIVLEGTADASEDDAVWKEYGFQGKPGDLSRRPPQVAPYHLRLDWLMWFLPFSVAVGLDRLRVRRHDLWFLRLVERLLEGDRAVLGLLRSNPFPEAPPRLVRARFYRYEFTTPTERKATGAWWQRRLIGDFLPPTGRGDLRL